MLTPISINGTASTPGCSLDANTALFFAFIAVRYSRLHPCTIQHNTALLLCYTYNYYQEYIMIAITYRSYAGDNQAIRPFTNGFVVVPNKLHA